jgi:hypothetical protein
MTNPRAIHLVGSSIVTYLERAFADQGRTQTGIDSCTFRLLSSADFLKVTSDFIFPTVSLYLYRVTLNEHMRNAPRKEGEYRREVPLPLDLHYLLTVWAEIPLQEHTLLAWTMQELYLHPILDASILSNLPNGGVEWQPGDAVKIVPAELSTEDVMRIWDALEPSYRLSVSYTARVVRVDRRKARPGLPVVATRYIYSGLEEELPR